MKNNSYEHDCLVCRALNQAQKNNQDVSLVELKISFKSSRENFDDNLDWENDTMEE